ncbi:conserved hypothetical protein [Leishmania major strain Friedlin]|uniref:Small nuclear RNA-activating protein n=1 Tax=Leishmania major TaxID=5664 RepID=Q4Q1G9_LEIMA|nr:conserved hypothetical protein [Leishmania major strain Friedlin]CAG9583784.1 small_nuclear_RNA-activating_protein [Leishmania major strain Friedlin]CAJ09210.1 conserved hypothetical protein [Leishmania major strain Friedlin]|eukprot:XP_001686829.1 conserved hypothetical protein [Leishmania major strain Friedlin]
MPRDTDRERLTAFAKDYAQLYARFANHFAIPERATIDDFAVLFDASHIEYLHYCGGTTLERPFFPVITSELLMLSSAYLSIPEAVAPRGVRTFGLLLSFFIYSTQPARQRPKVPASVATEGKSLPPVQSTASFVESALPRSGGPRASRIAMMADSLTSSSTQQPQSCSAEERTAATAPPSPPVPLSLRLPMQPVPVSVSCMRLLLSRLSIDAGSGVMSGQPSAGVPPLRTAVAVAPASASPAQLSHTEAKVVLALRRATGWHIEPYLQQGKHISALLSAHQACAVPLVQHVTPVPRSLFAATLTARSMLNASAAPEEVGGPDSLFRDPDFVRLRQGYEAARRRLLLGERR